MSAGEMTGNGFRVMVALEEATTGDQVILMARSTNLSQWGVIYNPGAGSAANVKGILSNEWGMFFHGNFNTDVVILLHVINPTTGGETTTDLSPASLGAKVANTMKVNPSGVGEAWATINTDQDLLRTIDAGSNWTALDAALGYDPTALEVLWSGANWPDRSFIAGKPASVQLDYSPNELADKNDQASAALAAVANICSVVAIPHVG